MSGLFDGLKVSNNAPQTEEKEERTDSQPVGESDSKDTKEKSEVISNANNNTEEVPKNSKSDNTDQEEEKVGKESSSLEMSPGTSADSEEVPNICVSENADKEEEQVEEESPPPDISPTENENDDTPPPPTSRPPDNIFKNLPPASKPVLRKTSSFSTDHALTNTPVSNPSALLRILNKFTEKAAVAIPRSATNPNSSLLSRIFGSSSDNESHHDDCLEAFSLLLSNLEDEDTTPRQSLSSFVHLVSIWAHSRTHLDLMSPPDGASSKKQNWITAQLLCMCIDTAQSLVAHGCLDHFYIILPQQTLPVRAIHVLAESVFLSELSDERTELAALKFLLTTGCRIMEGGNVDIEASEESKTHRENGQQLKHNLEGEAMLRGTHLLQTIRVCYHVYLKTGSESNKTTARAALQQLIASIFVRMARNNSAENAHLAINGVANTSDAIATNGTTTHDTILEGEDDKQNSGGIEFPTLDHRDAFLVLRSLCKLSMKTVSEGQSTSSSSRPSKPRRVANANEGGATWDTNEGMTTATPSKPLASTSESETNNAGVESSSTNGTSNSTTPSKKTPTRNRAKAQLMHDPMLSASNVSPLSQNPALESKVIALELILYILSLDHQTSLETPSSPVGSSISSSYANHLASSQPFQFAIRHYLCVSLLKNSTSNITRVVGLSLRIFVPLIRHFRSHLKTEIEAFVTNVFFVILDSPNSTMEHKSLVVTLFEEICSDPDTLAEIFLNYDCDLSAVDLFHRIVNTLGKVAKVDETNLLGGGDGTSSELESFVNAGAEKRKAILRQANRQLRLDAMRALRQVLASLHASIVIPLDSTVEQIVEDLNDSLRVSSQEHLAVKENVEEEKKQNSLVQIYDSKKKFKQEQLDAILRFNRSPAKGIAYAGECGHIDASDPVDVARYLLQNGKDTSKMEKTQIGEYLGREAEYQKGFCLRVLHEYTNLLDFEEMDFDEAIRYFLSGFRLPGEAQKIDRIMEKFAERYCAQNPTVFPTADAAFILAFAVIMLNTDLHNPAIKEERRMTKDAFIRMNRGICEGEDLPDELLTNIFGRIQTNPISLKEDDEARERAGVSTKPNVLSSPGLSPAVFFGNHYDEMERARESNYLKERDQILRSTESLFKRRRRPKRNSANGRALSPSRASNKNHSKFVRTQDTGLRDEYVTPMFEVTWGVCLAVFSTALESANGTASAIATFSDEEKDLAWENAMEATEVCLTAVRLAICTAGLCGNDTARGAFVHALANFSLLGSGKLMEHRHVRCVQALLRLGQEDGELLGDTWEHVFRALSEVYRLNQVYEVLVRNERIRIERERQIEDELLSGETFDTDDEETDDDSTVEAEEKLLQEMDRRSIDEANARALHEVIPETIFDIIFHRSSSLSSPSVKDFILQLCRVSRMEISGYGGHVGSRANKVDLENSLDRQHNTLFPSNDLDRTLRNNQPVIYSLQKLVEVAHYNMDSRPRLIFADLWSTIAGHLTSTALHSNAAVAMYAVDSFRQLSIHFLQKEELGVFEFQRRFLKPFESVMAKSDHVSTKELLLKCVEQIILMFGSKDSRQQQGMLRSGWRPVLAVLGRTGHEAEDSIAEAGFKMLNEQLTQCLEAKHIAPGDAQQSSNSVPLVTEHFVELVDALVMFISGKRIQMSLSSIDRLVELSTLIAEGVIPLPNLKRRGESEGKSSELELWWPILLGLSQSIGDKRRAVREKALKSLFDLINTFFLTSTNNVNKEDEAAMKEAENNYLQTLQLIFRGILIPTLEYAETDMDSMSPLPQDFPHLVTRMQPKKRESNEVLSPYDDLLVNDDDMNENSWIVTTFGPLLDGCISICLESMKIYESDLLIEEVLAVINTCLLSDSGALAVTGLRRLHKLITVDLAMDAITDDTWAAICHMLRRCLSVRGLTSVTEAVERKNAANGQSYNTQAEDESLINEFIMEEDLFAGRRYTGCNATLVIGTLLCDSKYSSSIGKRWSLFLMKGLAKGIKDWEDAAGIVGLNLEDHAGHQGQAMMTNPSPPHYLENVLYGQQWMIKFILLLADEERNSTDGEEESAAKSRHSFLKEQTQTIISTFLDKESKMDGFASATSTEGLLLGACHAGELGHLTQAVCELLEEYNKFDNGDLYKFNWLCPMLSSLIQSNNRAVRNAVHILVTRFFEGPLTPR